MTEKRACVVVIGDVGRSPRMQYHALSLAKEGYCVDIVGYSGSPLHSELTFNPAISVHYMKTPPSFSASKLFSYFLKTFWQTFTLLFTLCWISKPNFILVQNPPSIPTLPVCWFVSWIRRIHLVVDWHNYGTVYSNFYLALLFSIIHRLYNFGIKPWGKPPPCSDLSFY